MAVSVRHSVFLFLAAVLSGGHAATAYAQTTRFSNWEFAAPQMLKKAEQTSDRLVLKLDPSIPGAGGTITLRAGQPSKGSLSAQLDSEWKKLASGKKLLTPEPDEQTELADGTKGIKRGAPTAGGGYFSVSAYQAPGGINFIVLDAGDEMATQMLGGVTFAFFGSLKVHPVGATASARTGASRDAQTPPAESPLEEMARLNREMMQMPLPDLGASGARSPRTKSEDGIDPIPIPKLDKARIASIPKRVLSDQEIPKYVRETVPLVEAKLSPEVRTLGDKILRELKTKHPGPVAIESTAIGAYAVGNLELALYLMGKAAATNPADATTLNNYAAFLSMGGADQRAVAILQNLEKKYPNDATVLNNLGQAWFGLGDIAKANTYIGRVLWLRPGHSQANMTRSVIEEAKGNKRGAVESMKKSMKQGFSEEKLSHLERLDYALNEKEIPWDEPFKEDPLKLHKVMQLVPPYYYKASDLPVAEARWSAYRDAIRAMKEQLAQQGPALAQANEESLRKFQGQFMAGRKRFSPLAMRFTLKYITYGKRHEELINQWMRWDRDVMEANRKIGEWYRAAESKIRANPHASCGTHEAIVSEFMSKANTLLSNVQSEAKIRNRIRWFNEWAQISRYYNSPTKEHYQFVLHAYKASFLDYMLGLEHRGSVRGAHLCPEKKATASRSGPLQVFEDIHCEKHYSYAIPMIGVIRVNCHYLTTEFDVAGIVKGSTKEDLITGEFVRGTLEIGAQIGKGSRNVGGKDGPLSVEVRAKGGGFIEFDKDGISDMGVEVGVEAGVSTDVLDKAGPEPWMKGDQQEMHEMLAEQVGRAEQGIDVGISTRIGVNSGVTVSGTGALEGLSTHSAW